MLGVTLTPGQRAVALVAYDGVQPRELRGAEREMARRIFGDVETVTDTQRATFVAIVGGRAGKSYVLVALRMVWGMFDRNLDSLATGQRAVALVIAPNDGLRQEVVNYALGAIRSSPLAPALILPKGATSDSVVAGFAVKRADGRLVRFEAGVATAGGYGGRGRALTDAALDEAAFFRDSGSVVNDAAIYSAASPRVLPGGQTMVTTTPWAQSGLSYELFARNWGKPQDALVAHAPTTILNDSAWVAEMVERERQRDPDNARREFDAEFMQLGTLQFFEGQSIEAAVRLPGLGKLQPGDTVVAGADFGFRSDSSALIIVVRRAAQLFVAECVELRPEGGVALQPGDVVRVFAEVCKRWGAKYVMADGHYRESITEHLKMHGLVYAPAPATPSGPYVRVRGLLRESRLSLPQEPRLIQQMREVQGRPQSGGGISIIHPRWATGGHGDLCAALVLAVDQAGGTIVPVPKPVFGSDDWEAKERKERRLKAQAALDGAPTDRGANSYWRRSAG